MNLQYFAEEPADDESVDTSQTEETTETEESTGKTFSRDDIAKMMAAEKAKWDSENEARLAKAKKEGEELAKMTAKEREDAEAKKREDALSQREQDLVHRELTATAKDELVKAKLPQRFLKMAMAGADNEEAVLANIKDITEEWTPAVNDTVTERLKRDTPEDVSSSDNATDPFASKMAKYQ